ncbi:MAG: 4-hydroxythreonine-4-phosphate dehydrogenase PdxA [Burkholderiales bacterium]|jgi:4-hydroxythreonine-4-phosphate dehydrogenase|nr:4-hydroxythreonine-4-phosphate dehydrogenase PdxA [Burkholderiales bacterium]
MANPNDKPVVALTLGDPAGIGAELIARLLAIPATCEQANVVLLGDRWLWEQGQRTAGVRIAVDEIASLDTVRGRADSSRAAFLPLQTVDAAAVRTGVVGAEGGASALAVLDRCMDATLAGQVDAICFAPLNKNAMKLGGLQHEDELHHFAEYLGVDSYFCEFNTLDGLWTSRISSHVPLADVPRYVTRERVIEAASLIARSLQAAGVAAPRVAVAGLNPHNGDGGTCGRQEIDVIAPAVAELAARGLDVKGPFSPDTIFLRAREREFDAIVTMYHDQGQIALKLLGFSRGVTVQGGMPIPITTPAHGTAYDIAGAGRADPNAMAQAFAIAVRMGRAYREQRKGEHA